MSGWLSTPRLPACNAAAAIVGDTFTPGTMRAAMLLHTCNSSRLDARQRSEHGEMHLPVVIDGHHPDDRLGVAVACHQHRPGTDAGGIAGSARVDQPRPSSSSAFRSSKLTV